MKVSLQQKYMREINQKFSKDDFSEIPESEWPAERLADSVMPIKVLRSRDFLVQIFEEHPGYRLSVNRTMIDGEKNWIDGITWDDLFWLKNQVGYADFDAVELYPRKNDIVNVSNIRHLWVFKEPVNFAWRAKKSVDSF